MNRASFYCILCNKAQRLILKPVFLLAILLSTFSFSSYAQVDLVDIDFSSDDATDFADAIGGSATWDAIGNITGQEGGWQGIHSVKIGDNNSGEAWLIYDMSNMTVNEFYTLEVNLVKQEASENWTLDIWESGAPTTPNSNYGGIGSGWITQSITVQATATEMRFGIGRAGYNATFEVSSIKITGPDGTPPTPICRDISVSLSPAGTYTLTAGEINNGSTDNVGITGMSIDKTNFTTDDLGNNTVKLTVEDAAGNSDFCEAIVTVLAHVKPNYISSDTLENCAGQLMPAVPGADIDILDWRDYMADTVVSEDARPILSTDDTTIYVVRYVDFSTATYTVNGDFEDGTTAADIVAGGNTGYEVSPGCWDGSFNTVGKFNIGSSPSSMDPCDVVAYPTGWYENITDHTSGAGNMFYADGDTVTNQLVYKTTTQALKKDSTYALTIWLNDIMTGPSATRTPPNMVFIINNDTVGILEGDGTQGTWNRFYGFWKSDTNGPVEIKFINKNNDGGGNDFALDDINLHQVLEREVFLTKPLVEPEAQTRPYTLELDHATESGSIVIANVDNGSQTGPGDCDGVYDSITVDTMDFTYDDLGPNTVTLTVWKDGLSDSETAIVTVTFPNDPPVADDTTINIASSSNISKTLMSLVSDPDNDSVYIETPIFTDATKGTLALNADGSYTYTPNLTLVNTTDYFEYVVLDQYGASDTGRVTINITAPTNLAPEARDSSYDVFEHDVINNEDLMRLVSDPDGDPLSITTTAVTDVTSGTLVINGDGTFDYTPASTDTTTLVFFEYQVSDGNGGLDTGRIDIQVNPNLPPVARDSSYFTKESDALNKDLKLLITDPEGGALSINTSEVADNITSGVLSINADGTFDYTPAILGLDLNFYFTYEVEDMYGEKDTGRISIQIVSNLPPIARDSSYDIAEHSILNKDLNLLVSDPEGDDTLIHTSPVTAVASGTLVINANGTFDYTPASTDTVTLVFFEYEVEDVINGGRDTSRIDIRVLPNLPPVARDSSYRFDETTTLNKDLSLLVSDPENNAITYITNPVTDVLSGTLNINAGGTFDYTPVNITDTSSVFFEYEVEDIYGERDTARIDITIYPNFPPIARDSSYTVAETDTLRKDLKLLVSDPESGALTIAVLPATDVASGDLTINANGTFEYAPANIADTSTVFFEYTVSDDQGQTATGRIDITIYPNFPPTVLDSTYQVEDIDSLEEDFTTGYIIDPEGDPTTLNTIPVTNTTLGILVINANGTFKYTPPATLVPLNDFFEYEVCDAHNNCTTGRIDIEILPTLPPVTTDTNYTVIDTEELDKDLKDNIWVNIGSKNVDVIPLTSPKHGTLTINIDGTFNFVPNTTDVELLDTFIYNTCSDAGKCTTGRVFIRIVPNPPPQTVGALYTIYDTDTIDDDLSQYVIDLEGDPFIINTGAVVSVTGGLLSIKGDQSFVYQPIPTGVEYFDTFAYSVCAPFNKCDTGYVYIRVIPNLPPITPDYAYSTDDTISVLDDVLKNVSEPNGDAISLNTTPSLVPVHGQVTINSDGTFKYTPDTLASVIDSFSYTVCDERGACSSGTVTIFVAHNPPPVTPAYYYECYNTQFIKDDLKKGLYDPDGSPVILNTTPVTAPKHGTVTINADGSFVYIPLSTTISKADSFHYSACDPDFNCKVGVVYISVDKTPQIDITVTTPLCQGVSSLPVDYSYKNSVPDIYSVRHGEALLAQGFIEVERQAITTPGSLAIDLPGDLQADSYAPHMMFEENIIRVQVLPVPFDILYPPDILAQKWNNVIAIYTQEFNGGYDFYDFRWLQDDKYINNSNSQYAHIDGENGPILHFDPDAPVDTVSEFSCNLKRHRDDKWIKTCPMKMEIRNIRQFEIYPVVASNQELITVTSPSDNGSIKIWDIQGNLKGEYPIEQAQQSFQAPQQQGVYMVEIKGDDGYTEVKKVFVR